MKLTFGLTALAGLSLLAMSANAQTRNLSLVEGTACAYLSAQIEESGQVNEELLNEISDAQASNGGRGNKTLVSNLSFHREQLVLKRQILIQEYAQRCSTGKMTATNLRRICRTDSGPFDFSKTVFCKPLIDAGL